MAPSSTLSDITESSVEPQAGKGRKASKRSSVNVNGRQKTKMAVTRSMRNVTTSTAPQLSQPSTAAQSSLKKQTSVAATVPSRNVRQLKAASASTAARSRINARNDESSGNSSDSTESEEQSDAEDAELGDDTELEEAQRKAISGIETLCSVFDTDQQLLQAKFENLKQIFSVLTPHLSPNRFLSENARHAIQGSTKKRNTWSWKSAHLKALGHSGWAKSDVDLVNDFGKEILSCRRGLEGLVRLARLHISYETVREGVVAEKAQRCAGGKKPDFIKAADVLAVVKTFQNDASGQHIPGGSRKRRFEDTDSRDPSASHMANSKKARSNLETSQVHNGSDPVVATKACEVVTQSLTIDEPMEPQESEIGIEYPRNLKHVETDIPDEDSTMMLTGAPYVPLSTSKDRNLEIHETTSCATESSSSISNMGISTTSSVPLPEVDMTVGSDMSIFSQDVSAVDDSENNNGLSGPNIPDYSELSNGTNETQMENKESANPVNGAISEPKLSSTYVTPRAAALLPMVQDEQLSPPTIPPTTPVSAVLPRFEKKATDFEHNNLSVTAIDQEKPNELELSEQRLELKSHAPTGTEHDTTTSHLPSTDTEGALTSLLPGRDVSCSAIAMVLSHFNLPSSRFRILDGGLIDTADPDQLLQKDALRDHGATCFVVPLNIQNHWTTGVIDFRNGCTYHYNSLKADLYTISAQKSLSVLREHLTKSNDLPKHDIWQFIEKACPQQENLNDCGVCCIIFAIHHLAETEVVSLTAEYCRFWRYIGMSACGAEGPFPVWPDMTDGFEVDEEHAEATAQRLQAILLIHPILGQLAEQTDSLIESIKERHGNEWMANLQTLRKLKLCLAKAKPPFGSKGPDNDVAEAVDLDRNFTLWKSKVEAKVKNLKSRGDDFDARDKALAAALEGSRHFVDITVARRVTLVNKYMQACSVAKAASETSAIKAEERRVSLAKAAAEARLVWKTREDEIIKNNEEIVRQREKADALSKQMAQYTGGSAP